MGVACGLLSFFWLTRELSPWILTLLCLGMFLTVAGLGAWEGGRRLTPYTRAERAQRADEQATCTRRHWRWHGWFLLGVLVLYLTAAVWHSLTTGWSW